MEQFDLIVIGSGPGGYVGAIRAAQLGMAVAVIERGAIGGTCLNRGCIPTKALLHTAELYREAREDFAAIGIDCAPPALNPSAMYAYKDDVVAKLQNGVVQLLKSNGVTVVEGTARIEAPGQVSISAKGAAPCQLKAKHTLIATGSRPALPPIPGADLPGVCTSDDLVQNVKIPKSIAIIGAGVIGIEFASLYAALGSEVTLLEMAPRALPGMGREVAQSVVMMLKKQGVALFAPVAVKEITRGENEDSLACHFTYKDAPQSVVAETVLIAAGRRPVLENLFADGLAPASQKGFLTVDDTYCTSIPGLYAIGDVIPGPQLAHAASAEAIAAVEGMAGKAVSKQANLVPSCVYTQPEIACVGLNEEQAAQQGIDFTANKFLMTGNGRVLIDGGERSYCKLIAETKTGRLIGAELICPRASDLIAGITLAIKAGMKAEELDGIVYPHPTFSEGVGEAAAMFGGGAIHAQPRPKRKT